MRLTWRHERAVFVIEFFEWERGLQNRNKPWLVLGKGPSFTRHKEFSDIDVRFLTVGLNHTCRDRKMFVTHIFDANVLDELPDLIVQCDYLLMPWYPHVNFGPTPKTLQDFVNERSMLTEFDQKERLLWYNASTGGLSRGTSPKVKVLFFSGDAIVRLLAMAGVKVIRTLGIDGGTSYAPSFKDIKPLRGGNTTYDFQNGPIQATVKEFCLDYAPLYEKPI